MMAVTSSGIKTDIILRKSWNQLRAAERETVSEEVVLDEKKIIAGVHLY